MKFRTLAVVATAAFLPLTAVACSDDKSSGGIDKGEFSEQLQTSGMPKEQADCVADALKDADVTEDDLKSLATDTTSEKGKAYLEAVQECIGSDISIPE